MVLYRAVAYLCFSFTEWRRKQAVWSSDQKLRQIHSSLYEDVVHKECKSNKIYHSENLFDIFDNLTFYHSFFQKSAAREILKKASLTDDPDFPLAGVSLSFFLLPKFHFLHSCSFIFLSFFLSSGIRQPRPKQTHSREAKQVNSWQEAKREQRQETQEERQNQRQRTLERFRRRWWGGSETNKTCE